MTHKDFATWAVGYYGPWPKGMQADIFDYLTEKTPEYLAMLKRVCLEKVPSRIGQVNGYPPDIAKLEETAEDVGARIEAEIRHVREIEHAAKMLPAPDLMGGPDIYRADWSKILAEKIAGLTKAKSFP